jgi:hypothetical protein
MRTRVLVQRSFFLSGDVKECAVWLISVLARCADQQIVYPARSGVLFEHLVEFRHLNDRLQHYLLLAHGLND